MKSYFDFSSKSQTYLVGCSSQEIESLLNSELQRKWKHKQHNISGKKLSPSQYLIHLKFSGVFSNLYMGPVDRLRLLFEDNSSKDQTRINLTSKYGISLKYQFMFSMIVLLLGLTLFGFVLKEGTITGSLGVLIIPAFGFFYGLILMFWREQERTKLISSFDELLVENGIEVKKL
ncbi:hypothetical protein [Aureitalea marina]|uniref:Uncharacterized protein n=1 Tax=Aureitalea marina TaxID=930804 RepID=A0A2S7KTD0_9FLAO|nr:hypothetical protein [Aureitalea marina]PQB05793.1 hypothetical protein BST85_13480 [Aureitalea marina]